MTTRTKQPTQCSSQETDRRHLLSPSQNTTPTPSAATSMLDYDPAATPRARSPAVSVREESPQQQQQAPSQSQQSYKGFPSEAAYLAALREWADSQKYLEPEIGLQGFYGNVTMEQYARRPRLEGLGLRRKVKGWRQRQKGAGVNVV